MPRHPFIMRPRFSLLTAVFIASPSLSLCLASPPAPFLVSAGGASCVSLSSRHASRLPSCVLLIALRSAHPRGVITDVIASSLRSAATVPPPTRLALSPRLFMSGGGEMSSGEVGSGTFSCGIFAQSGAFLSVLVI